MNRILAVTLKTLSIRGFAALALAASLALLLSASPAHAGCGFPLKATAAPAIPFLQPQTDRSQDHHDGDESDRPASIVGLWHLIYTATASDLPSPPFPPQTPFQFLESYKTWHADGTEFENAFLPPAGGNICFGVWKDWGRGRVKLHHIGLMFASDGTISNVFTVDEIDKVASDGKTYSGTFEFKLFGPTDVLGTGKPLAQASGTTQATRITVD
jgi:hypothetical protein